MDSILHSISGYAYYICYEEKEKKREFQCKKTDVLEAFSLLSRENFTPQLNLITVPQIYPQFTHPYFVKKSLVKKVSLID